jgi:hypothetical protein
MRPELLRLQFIEQHLLAAPSAAADWATHLLLDPDLATDIEAQRQLYAGLHAAGQQQLRRELNAMHAQLYGVTGPRHWLQQVRAAARLLLRRRR